MSLTPETLLAFLKDCSQPQSKRDIARTFGIKGGPKRVELKKILKNLEESGKITKHSGGTYSLKEGLPSVTIIEISDIDIDGDVFAKAVDFSDFEGRIEVQPDKKGHPALKEKDRALAALSKQKDGMYSAKILKRLDTTSGQVIGLVIKHANAYTLEPANKKARNNFTIQKEDLNNAKDGDMAVGEIQSSTDLKNKSVRIIEIIGQADDPKAISLLSLHEVGLRTEFPEDVLASTKDMKVPPLGKREDLRKTPLITIDGADARDFDDAVFAEKTDDGYHLIVAIADVSYYVRPDSALDKEAYVRGNSTYFPDRVLPMLPEALSNDLCSLRPHEDRACLAAHLWINKSGKLLRHKFVRALMRSHARCTYEQVQAAYDGQKDKITTDIYDDIIAPLYDAFAILETAREKRGALDLDVPERQILIDDQGDMTGVRVRTRLDAHKLIEEFMILANVAAAEALEAKRAPCLYRIHDAPKPDRLSSAGEFIEGFGLSLPKGQKVSPLQLNGLLKQASNLDYAHLVHQVILRSQSQAVYAPENIGHYGLALAKYAHFTSPIRRYADLIVHRSLVDSYGLGEGGLSEGERARMAEIAEQISGTERKSIEAERNSVDRFTAAYLSDQVGAEFSGRISGVTRFGLFVTLIESGADGIVPVRSLNDDYYVHDEERHALIGRRKRTIYRLGAEVTVRLKEADGLTGSTVLELVGHNKGADIPGYVEPKRRGDAKNHTKKGEKRFSGKKSIPKPKKKKTTTPKHKKRQNKKVNS